MKERVCPRCRRQIVESHCDLCGWSESDESIRAWRAEESRWIEQHRADLSPAELRRAQAELRQAEAELRRAERVRQAESLRKQTEKLREEALIQLKACTRTDFLATDDLWGTRYKEIVTKDELASLKADFVQDWFRQHPGMDQPDDEQAAAIAATGSNI